MRYHVTCGRGEGAREIRLSLDERGDEIHVVLEDDGRRLSIDTCALEGGRVLHLLIEGRSYDAWLEEIDGGYEVQIDGEIVPVVVVDERELLARSLHGTAETGRRELRASMPGIVVSIAVGAGTAVETGQTLLVVEAMKMQNPLASRLTGEVAEVHVETGQAVNAGDLLVTFA